MCFTSRVLRSSDEVKTTVVTDKATEPQSTGEAEGERKREGEPTTEEAERGDKLQPQLVGGLEKDKTEEGKQTQSETTSADDTEPRVAGETYIHCSTSTTGEVGSA